jgi:seryl-tRNA synthetase
MLQISFLRDKKEEALQRLAIKNFNDFSLVEKALDLDNERKKTQTELDSLQNKWVNYLKAGKLLKQTI